jgi:RNA polymerase sigma-54 factor
MLRNTLGQILQQKLSPQAIQAQLLLVIPTLALEQEIKKQLEENPVLEEAADSVSDKPDEAEIRDDYSIESWSGNGHNNNYSAASSEDRTDYLINRQNRSKESPLEQVYNLGLDSEQLLIAEEILGSIEDDGYLRIGIEEIIEDIKQRYNFEPSEEEVESVLRIVQKLEPVGIAARNLQECLSVQLNEPGLAEPEDRDLCLMMINEYFEDFKLKHFEKLAKSLNVSLEKVNELFEIIQRLNPAPGKQDLPADYIYPDFLVSKVDGRLLVELNSDSRSGIRISRKYLEMLKSPKTEKETKEFLKSKVESAKWFLNAIQSRRDTMLKVMNAIIERQREFFEFQGGNLKPMFEKDIAEDIGMDVSTVSRVVRGKYVQTDFGIFELKYFFSSSMKTESGEDVSNKVYKEKIKELIESEDKAKPLNDDKLAELMIAMGYNIARRTVAKYRESMKIPKATLRRKILL